MNSTVQVVSRYRDGSVYISAMLDDQFLAVAELSRVTLAGANQFLPAGTPIDWVGDVYYFNRLFVPIACRNRGIGKALMSALIRMSNEEQFSILCWANAYGGDTGLSQEQLEAFYGSFDMQNLGSSLLIYIPTIAQPRGVSSCPIN